MFLPQRRLTLLAAIVALLMLGQLWPALVSAGQNLGNNEEKANLESEAAEMVGVDGDADEIADSEALSDEPEDPENAPPLHLPLTLEQRFAQAEWVSLVRVEGMGTLINPTMSRAQHFSAVQGYNYRAAVLRDWKGEQPAAIKFRVDLTDCLHPLDPEVEYIVFGIVNLDGKYQSLSCGDIIANDRESGLASSLDQLRLSDLSPSQ